MNSSFPLVSIITVNYNAHEATLDLLDSIKANSYPNYEIIVVDNNSEIDHSHLLLSSHPEITLINSETNLGFAGGNNLGIRKAKGDYFLFINNDAVLENQCIENLLESFKQKADCGIVSPKFHYYHKPGIIEYAGCTEISTITGRNKTIGANDEDQGQFDQLSETSFCHGGGMMISRKVIEEVGEIPEVYFLYYEEFEWCEKVKRAGYKIYIQPNSLIRHRVSASIGQNSKLKTYYLTRSRVLFMKRNKPFWSYFIFIFYLMFISVPLNIIRFIIAKKTGFIKTYLLAIFWNFGITATPTFN